jgi:ABC-type multidrug transport system ATPase subunit
VILWKYVIPHTSQKRSGGGDVFWQRNYYDFNTDDSFVINPLYNSLYEQNHNGNKCVESIEKEGKPMRPDVPERYIETMQHYSLRNMEWRDSANKIVAVQDALLFVMIVILFMNGAYGSALLVLINRTSIFGVITTYNNLKGIENDAEKSMEKIVKILEAIDAQPKINLRYDEQIIDFSTSPETRKRIKQIHIDGLQIKIPASQSNDEEHEEERLDRMIVLDNATVLIEPSKCLLLDGPTGCGKSMTIGVLAGLYSGTTCRKMSIEFTTGDSSEAEFNQIWGSRCYISQKLSEDYLFNGKLQLPLFKLFPGCKSIEEVKKFLIDVFAIEKASIPSSLIESPHPKLSGGEIQRYVVASQVWNALIIRPDIMILDEIDRALDKETAVKVIGWIVTHLTCFFIIVSHLTEVKQMLFEKGLIKQVWTYGKTDDKQQIRITVEETGTKF